ncbi:dihydroorotate dehydrogenase [Anaeromicropila herbilytica]|uniref:Dihydroorotate dehydrogenase n=1 Tax=Anaeromicropila herbilytica TaxID=2785025 RepID=A0A7R7EME6_9FIRM|nr:dihydroorotate dehydrogenase [Anaeromicropila herbilytica]
MNPGLEVLRLAMSYGIGEITFYGYTMDNCKRPKIQMEAFSKACVEAVQLMGQESISLLVVGNTVSKSFPEELKPYCKRTDFHGGGIKVNLLVNYGWEWDLNCKDVISNENKGIMERLHSRDISRMDLIIRWGGMRRLSGFLPVQSVYSNFYIIDSMWPDFKMEDFNSAMKWYEQQDNTLGG